MEDQSTENSNDHAIGIEVKLSGKTTVVIRELTGLEVRLVNKISGQDVGNIADNQALMSIVSINGEKLIPVKNDLHLQERASRFGGSEYMKLISAYAENFLKDFNDPKS